MNAPHPIRAAYGGLARPIRDGLLPPRGPAVTAADIACFAARGDIDTGMRATEEMLNAVEAMVAAIERGVGAGAGDMALDAERMGRAADRLGRLGIRMEVATATLVARACDRAAEARDAGIALASDGGFR